MKGFVFLLLMVLSLLHAMAGQPVSSSVLTVGAWVIYFMPTKGER